MTHVICLKHGTLYSAEYVNKLYNSVKRNTTHKFEFTCFTEDTTDVMEHITCRPLPYTELHGWWHKLYFFCPELGITDRILYLDLDTVIVKNIDEFFEYNGDFAILRDFFRTRNNPNCLEYGSAIMSWQPNWGTFIWDHFRSNSAQNMQTGGGDQKYLMSIVSHEKVTYWQDYLKRSRVVSYKAHVRDEPPTEEVPDNASIICFHGAPRPHEVRDLHWMKQHWK